ncbi:MAG: glycosyltransferase [Pseudomonadota bacterium]
MLSVVIPANNEEAYVEACLASVFSQTVTTAAAGGLHAVLSANACSDRTVAVAESMREGAEAAGWRLTILDRAEPGKPGALNAADAAAGPMAPGDVRVYLDADVVAEPALFAELLLALATDAPRYASGRLKVAPAKSFVTRAYADFWRRLPFMTHGVPGAGLFAVNAAGRARWDEFPSIISDDTYVRLSFAPHEREAVDAGYLWPMVEGFSNIRRVRARQNEGVEEVYRHFPDLEANNDRVGVGPGLLLRLALAAPIGFAVYSAMSLAVKRDMARRKAGAWTRGR